MILTIRIISIVCSLTYIYLNICNYVKNSDIYKLSNTSERRFNRLNYRLIIIPALLSALIRNGEIRDLNILFLLILGVLVANFFHILYFKKNGIEKAELIRLLILNSVILLLSLYVTLYKSA